MKQVLNRYFKQAVFGFFFALCLCVPILCVPAGIAEAATVGQLFPDAELADTVADALNISVNDQVTQAQLDSVTALNGTDKGIKTLEGISNLPNLTNLNMSENPDLIVPSEIGSLVNLTVLNLSVNPGMAVPAEIGNLTALIDLYLNDCGLQTLPDTIGNLTQLQTLNLNTNALTTLPASMGTMTSLTGLYAGENKLTDVPDELTNLSNLTTLNLGTNLLTHIPQPMLNLTNLETLYLDNNQLSGPVPDDINQLENLQLLYLYSNHITSLPDSMGTMVNLVELACNANEITYVPQSLENLPKLRLLHVDKNRVTSALPVLTNVDYHNGDMIASLPQKTIAAGGPLTYTDVVPDAMQWAWAQNGDTFTGLGTWTLTKPDASTVSIPAGNGGEINGSLFTVSGDYTLVFTFEDANEELLARSVYTMPLTVSKPTVTASDITMVVGETKTVPDLTYTPAGATLTGSIADSSVATIRGMDITGVRVGETTLTLQAEDAYGNLSDPVIVHVTVNAPAPAPGPEPGPSPEPSPPPAPTPAPTALAKTADSAAAPLFAVAALCAFGLLIRLGYRARSRS